MKTTFGGSPLRYFMAAFAMSASFWSGSASAQQDSTKKTPFDELKAADIPAVEHFPWQPKGLVAVFGSHAWHYWPIGSNAVMHLTTDGKRVAVHAWNAIAGLQGDTLRVTDAATSKDLAVFQLPKDHPAKGAGFSPSGRFVALCHENELGWGATVWNVAAKKVQYRVSGKGTSPTHVYFSPNGKLLGCALAGVQFFDLPSGKHLFGNPAQPYSGPPIFHPTANRVYYRHLPYEEDTGLHRAFLFEFDLNTRKERLLMERTKSFVPGIHVNPVIGLAISPDGRWLASALQTTEAKAENFVYLWNLVENKLGAKIACPGTVTYLAFSPDNKTLAIAQADGRIYLHERGSGKLLRSLEASPASYLHNLAFNSDGKSLAAADSVNSQLLLWDLATDQPLHENTEFIKVLAVSPDSQRLLMTRKNGPNSVTGLFDLVSKRLLPIGSIDQQLTVDHAAFSPDGRALALIVSRVGSTVLRVISTDTGKDLDAKHPHILTNDGVAKFVFFHPDGKQVVTAGGGSCFVWDLTTWKVQTRKYPWSFAHAVLSHEGKSLVADTSENIKVINLANLDVIQSFNREQAGLVAVSRDGTKVAHAGQYSSAAQVVNRQDGEILYEFKGHLQPITALCFDRKAETLFTAGNDGRLIRWFSAASKQEWRVPGPIRSIQLSPEGRHVLLSNANGTAYVLRVEDWE